MGIGTCPAGCSGKRLDPLYQVSTAAGLIIMMMMMMMIVIIMIIIMMIMNLGMHVNTTTAITKPPIYGNLAWHKRMTTSPDSNTKTPLHNTNSTNTNTNNTNNNTNTWQQWMCKADWQHLPTQRQNLLQRFLRLSAEEIRRAASKNF